MDQVKLFDSELKLMELLWDNSPITAKELTLLAREAYEWNKNTTYTIIKKLVDKDVIIRDDPGFVCSPLVTREQIQEIETDNLINKLFRGSRKAFFAAFIDKRELSADEINELRRIIEKSGK